MIDMYSKLVKAGMRTIEKVPDQYRDAVMANLATLKFGKNKDAIPSQSISNVIVPR